MPLDRDRLAVARSAAAKAADHVVAVEHDLARAKAELNQAVMLAADPTEVERLGTNVEELDTRRHALLREHAATSRIIDRLRLTARAPRTFEKRIGDLDGSVPVAMLPIRLETRFMNRNRELWVRLFPDAIHQHRFEPELTDDEVAAATEYWTTRWAGDTAATRASWERLAVVFGATRARWIIDVTTPTNLDTAGTGDPKIPDVARKAAPWSRPAVARQLPERWVVLGYREGREVLRVWGRPIRDDLQMGPAPDVTATDTAHPSYEPPDTQDEMAIDDGLRWMVDFDTAVAAGMALKVTERDVSGGVAGGFDLLIALGVDWTLDPKDAAAAFADHLTAHSYTDGLSFVPVGTATNVTDDSAPPAGVFRDLSLLDPAIDRTPAADAAGRGFVAALGLGGAPRVEEAPGALDRSDLSARHMNTALWAPTWGYFLEQMMRPHFTTGQVDQVRIHAVEHVRGRGPLSTLRLGRQPYGVLPVIATTKFEGATAFERSLAGGLTNLKRYWLDAADRVPSVVESSTPDETLVELLRMSPRSETFRFRQATGAAAGSSFAGLIDVATFQELLALWLLGTVGVDTRPAIVDVTLADGTTLVPLPMATSNPSPTDPLDPNYIATILGQLQVVGGFKRLVGDPAKASTLLDALLRQSAQIEVARASYLVAIEAAIAADQIRPDSLANIESVVMPREREVHVAVDDGLTVEVDDAPTVESVVLNPGETMLELADRSITSVSGRTSLANHIVELPQRDLQRRFSTRRFAEFRAALQHLATLPSEMIDELAAETLDCTSHRLDAWLTSLASRRLSDARRATPVGLHIGGYGWVEKLRPTGAPVSTGFVHAPSVAQAATAAVLRSGHLTRRSSGDDAFAVDLSSRRVSLALSILDGVRQGQPVGALLGYRFERGLRDRDLRLAQYILDFRRAAPLPTSTDGFDDGQPLETIAARDVVDGATLAERAQADVNGLLTEVGVASGDRSAVTAELTALIDALDAVSDLLVSESVHQAVMGNTERSGAALDALDRQTAPPDISVVRTPRTGVGVAHRMLVALPSGKVDPAWAALGDARSDAEPRLDAWVGAAIGDPSLVRISAVGRTIAADGTVTDVPIKVTLADLGISAISTVMASVGGANDRPSELHQRLADFCFGADPGADEVHFGETPPDGAPSTATGLAELVDLCEQLHDLIASARPATTSDLVAPNARADDAYDSGELQRRARRAVDALRRVERNLPAADAPARVERLAARLRAAADVGARNAIPLTTSDEQLREHVARVAADTAERLARVDALDAAFDRSVSSATEQIRHDTARLRIVFGEGFPVVPLMVPADPVALSAAAARSATITGPDPLAVTDWAQRYALVRPAMTRLFDVLEHVEARAGSLDATQFDVVQLASTPTEHWVGLPLATGGVFPAGALSIVVHHAFPLDLSGPLAALLVDQWSDTVPNTTETTGVSFHFDAPGVRAPQAILLATPPKLDAAGWSLDALISTVHEAIDLTHMRSVDADVLSGVGRFLPANYLTFNLERKAPKFDIWGLVDSGVLLQNVLFTEGNG